MIARSGVGEIVRRIQPRTVPQLVEISVKLIRARLGDVVDLRRSVSSLIHRIGKRIDRYLGDRIQAQHEIGREAAIQIGQRIVGFQSVNDVAVRERGQPVEFHVAVAVRAADEIVAAAGRVDQRAGGKLQRVGEIAAWIGKILQGRGIQGGGCVGVLRVEDRSFAADLNGLAWIAPL